MATAPSKSKKSIASEILHAPLVSLFKEGGESQEPPVEIQLLPIGHIPHPKGDVTVTPEDVRNLVSEFSGRANDLVVDYEHQSSLPMEAPAAGWITRLLDKGEAGLWGVVSWTKRAREYLANREYRYLSPAIFLDRKTRRPVRVISAALTNTPLIDGMVPIMNKAGDPAADESEDPMIEKLVTLLGLAAGASEDEVLAAVKALVDGKGAAAAEVATLKARIAAPEALSVLDLKEGATLDDVKAKVIEFKNPAAYVPVADHQALALKLREREVGDLVGRAIAEGKITPAQEKWAREYALKDTPGFTAFVEKATPVVPLKGAPGAGGGADGSAADAETLRICKLMGVSAEDLAKYGPKEGAAS